MIPTVAAILAGGLGTRLQGVVSDRSKTVAAIHNRPFLLYLLDQVAQAGLERVVLLTGYKGEQVADLLGPAYRGLQLEYSLESEPLGTGGALRLAFGKLFGSAPGANARKDERALVLNGDSYCAADLRAFGAFRERQRAQAALLLTEVADASRFGKVELEADGRIRAFLEKQPAAGPGWINAGVYLLDRGLIEEIPTGRAVSLEREMFPAWRQRGQLHGFCGGGAFLDIGTPESYRAAEAFFTQDGLATHAA